MNLCNLRNLWMNSMDQDPSKNHLQITQIILIMIRGLVSVRPAL
jgi:hypothetical protein